MGGAPHAGPVSVFNALSSNDELSIIRGRGHGAGADGCCPAFILFSRDPTGGLPHPTPAFAFDRHLQKMESGGLIIGRAGEKVVSDYHFLAVFQVPEYYLVKDENRSIGTVDKIYRRARVLPLLGERGKRWR